VVFTSDHPVAAQLRNLINKGVLAEAEVLLKNTQAESDPDLMQVLIEGKEVIGRLRREYNLDPPGLIKKLQLFIPDISSEDVQRWRKAGFLQSRIIDGKIRYFHREPANLFRFCEEAKQRRDEHKNNNSTQPSSRHRLLKHLSEVVAAAEDSGHKLVFPVRHRIRFRLTVHPNHPSAKAGSLVRCWLPFPQEYRQQTGVKLIRTKPVKYIVTSSFTDDNIIRSSQRSVYLEQHIIDPSQSIVFEEEFEYVSHAYYPGIKDADAQPLSENYNGSYLSERPPHIVFTPQLRQAVQQAIGQEENPLVKARKIFHFIANTIRYCSEEEYSIIPSFTTKALTTRKGDCGIQGMLFITMCRAAGIPARWQSGYQTRPNAWDIHDWAECYVQPWGWLPADVSYGFMDSDDPRIREFYFGHLDSYRLIVNMDYGFPLQPPKHSLRSEPADFQRGEVEIDGRNLYFDEWDWDFQVHAEPIPKK